MAQCRHWKQRFDPNAEMVFRKSRKLGLCGVERCEPGDPVTEEMKMALGRHRMKMWWEAGMLELREGSQLAREPELEPEAPASPPADESPELESPGLPCMVHEGGGWYEVILVDGSKHRVRGKKAAEAFLNGN